MKAVTAYSTQPTVEGAVKAIGKQFRDFNARLIVYFASSHFEPESLARKMHSAFPAA